jgi:hypothetical protein
MMYAPNRKECHVGTEEPEQEQEGQPTNDPSVHGFEDVEPGAVGQPTEASGAAGYVVGEEIPEGAIGGEDEEEDEEGEPEQ